MKIGVIIPALNEAKNIGGIISAIRGISLPAVVVDDGSSDATAEIARKHGATVIRNPVNLGKGASLRKGFQYALSQQWDALINMDGDGQHSPDNIGDFINAAQDLAAHIIIGNRMNNTSKMPLSRNLTNKFMSFIISSIVKQRIPDSQCGFRLIKCEVLRRINLRTSKFETESEILIKAAKSGCRLISIPVKTIYSDEKSSINPVKDTLRFIKFLAEELTAKN